MYFRTELKVESTFITETCIFQENHVGVVPGVRTEGVSGSSSRSAVGQFLCEVAGLHPAGIWIEDDVAADEHAGNICSNVDIRRASSRYSRYNSINQRQPHHRGTSVRI